MHSAVANGLGISRTDLMDGEYNTYSKVFSGSSNLTPSQYQLRRELGNLY